MPKITLPLKINPLPVAPEVAAELVASLNDDSMDSFELRTIIAKDPVITAKVLKIANSPFYGLQRKIGTLDTAITLLGFRKTRTQAITACIAGMAALPPGVSKEQYWKRSSMSAGYAMWLALAIGIDENEAWLTAMLLRVGEVVLAQAVDGQLSAGELQSYRSETRKRWQLQMEWVGQDEGQVAASLSRKWHFPPSFAAALECCADPMARPESTRLAPVLHLATLLAELDSTDQELLADLPDDVVQRIGLDLQWIAQYMPDRQTFIHLL